MQNEPFVFSSFHCQHYLFPILHLIRAFLEVIQTFDLKIPEFLYNT